MDAVNLMFSVPDIVFNRPLRELEAERYREEVREARRLYEQREQEQKRLVEMEEREERAEIPPYMGMQVDLLA